MSVMAFKKSQAKIVGQSETGVTFKDVAGIEEAKEELQEVVEFLGHKERYERLGAKIPKGVLLVDKKGNNLIIAETVSRVDNMPVIDKLSGIVFYISVQTAESSAECPYPQIIFIILGKFCNSV